MSYLEYVTVNDSIDPMGELSRSNKFTIEDLHENQRGQISAVQKGVLLKRALRPIQYPLMALAGWLFAYFVFRYGVPDVIQLIIAVVGGKTVTGVFVGFTVMILGALGIGLLKSGRLLLLLLTDLASGRVERLDGRVNISREEKKGLGLDRLHDRGRKIFYYVIREEYFEVDEEAVEAISLGGRYTIYHTPNAKLLLSIEPSRGD